MISTQTIFGIINWSLVLISIFIFLLIFYLYSKLVKRERENSVSNLLTINTSTSAFFTSITVLLMVSSNLFNHFLIVNLSFCYVFGLLYDTFECSIYYSYTLQSFYRLLRIRYYRKKSLLKKKLYYFLIIVQWLISIILLIPTIILQWYIHLPGEYYCLVPYTNLTGSIYLIIILYSVPLVTIILSYILITRYLRSNTAVGINERQRAQRDLTVMKRIIISISILIILRFPTIIFILFGKINGHLYFLTYPIVGLVTSTCLTFIAVFILLTNNQFKEELFKYFNQNNNNQINPINPISQIKDTSKQNT